MADAKPAVERLSEDESLRGDLSDIGFGPLLDWAVAAVEAYASKAADNDALDAYTNRVRGVVQSAVQAAQDSKLDDPNALLDFDPADREKALSALKALKLGDDPDNNGVQIAAVLQLGLTGAPAASPAQAQQSAAVPPAPVDNATSPAPPAPAQEAAKPPPSIPATAAEKPEQGTAQPVKKNEEAGESAGPPPQQGQNLNPEPPVNSASSNPRPGAFLDNIGSRVGQAYNSAWGIFKGLSKRRSG